MKEYIEAQVYLEMYKYYFLLFYVVPADYCIVQIFLYVLIYLIYTFARTKKRVKISEFSLNRSKLSHAPSSSFILQHYLARGLLVVPEYHKSPIDPRL